MQIRIQPKCHRPPQLLACTSTFSKTGNHHLSKSARRSALVYISEIKGFQNQQEKLHKRMTDYQKTTLNKTKAKENSFPTTGGKRIFLPSKINFHLLKATLSHQLEGSQKTNNTLPEELSSQRQSPRQLTTPHFLLLAVFNLLNGTTFNIVLHVMTLTIKLHSFIFITATLLLL